MAIPMKVLYMLSVIALALLNLVGKAQAQQRTDPNGHGIVCSVQANSDVDNHHCRNYGDGVDDLEAYQNQAQSVANEIAYIHNNGWLAVASVYSNDTRNANRLGVVIIFYRVHACDSLHGSWVDWFYELNLQTSLHTLFADNTVSSIEYWAESNCHPVWYQNLHADGWDIGHHLDGAYRGRHVVWDHLSDIPMDSDSSWNDRISSMYMD